MKIIIDLKNINTNNGGLKSVYGQLTALDGPIIDQCTFVLRLKHKSNIFSLQAFGENKQASINEFPSYSEFSFRNRLMFEWIGDHAQEILNKVR